MKRFLLILALLLAPAVTFAGDCANGSCSRRATVRVGGQASGTVVRTKRQRGRVVFRFRFR